MKSSHGMRLLFLVGIMALGAPRARAAEAAGGLATSIEFQIASMDRDGLLDTGRPPRLTAVFAGWYLKITSTAFSVAPLWTPNLAAGLFVAFDDESSSTSLRRARYAGPFVTWHPRWSAVWGGELHGSIVAGRIAATEKTSSTVTTSRSTSTSGFTAEFFASAQLTDQVELLFGPGTHGSSAKYDVHREREASGTTPATSSDSKRTSSTRSNYLAAVARVHF